MTYDLKSSLDDFAETAYADAPPSTIDIGKARADGRRRIAATRLVPIGGGVAVVAACALVVTTLGGTSPAGTTDGNGPAAHHTFTGTDPMVSVGTFGWLPDGFKLVTNYSTGPAYGDSVAVGTPRTEEEKARPLSGRQLTLTRWASEPKLSEYEHRTEMPLKGSKKAYLVTHPGNAADIPPDLSLLWQAGSGSWFRLGGDAGIHGDEFKALLTKVAESVRTEESPMPLPFHIEGLPKDLTLSSAHLADTTIFGKPGVAATLNYGNRDGGSVIISVEPNGRKTSTASDGSSGQANQNTGQSSDLPAPSISSSASNGPKTFCKESAGLRVCVDDVPGPNGVDPLASVGGGKGLLDRITSLGTDPANWTTHVVN